MNTKTVLSVTTNLSRYGGAQKVLVDVHNGLKLVYDAKIVGFQEYENIHPKYSIKKEEYIQLKNPFILRNKIIIVHARNLISFITFLNKILFLNSTVIYASHNVYNTYRSLTFFPDIIVSISKKVTENLINYFSVEQQKIHLIYNGIIDASTPNSQRDYESDRIKILYAARVNPIKRQLYLVNCLKENMRPNIQIHFAGIGDDFDELLDVCKNSKNFVALGFIEKMNELIPEYDYLMLYSVQEGLPLSLIEGILHGKPLLVNDVGGNHEIGVPGFNGFELGEDPDLLVKQINGLVEVDKDKYCWYSDNSRKRYLGNFTYPVMIEKYRHLIDNLGQ